MRSTRATGSCPRTRASPAPSIEAGLTWIGPSPESIESMALKVEAKRIAAAAGVPLAPGCELARAMTDDQIVYACARVGYPLIIKASAGGGGKGMRVVALGDDLVEAVKAARREAASAFGDDTVFAERYLAGARHVEVQVVGDAHKNVVHLFERECSIQRRHQKIIEEAPSPGVTPAVRGRLHEAAVALAKEIGYVGVGHGRVHGVRRGRGAGGLLPRDEHPAPGRASGDRGDHGTRPRRAADHRSPGASALPFRQADLEHSGHAIEARLYAEDPAHGYLPATGLIHRFAVDPAGARARRHGRRGRQRRHSALRPDAGQGHRPRIDAVRPRRACSPTAWPGMELHGPVTNRDSLVATLRSPAFLAGETTTAFLDEHPEVLDPQPDRRRSSTGTP